MHGKIFDASYIFKTIPLLLERVPYTLFLVVLSLSFGLILGLALTVISLNKNKTGQLFVKSYIGFMRGTPPLLLLLLVYYGLPELFQIIGVDINSWYKTVFAVIAFSLGISAFFSETMRSAYLAVDKGQTEAALSVGMSHRQALKRIIIPQAFTISIPNMGNLFIALFKESSFVFSIGINDIFEKAHSLSSDGYGVRQLEIFIALALIYWVICILIEQGIGLFERRHRMMIP